MSVHLLREVLATLETGDHAAAIAAVSDAIRKVEHPGHGQFTPEDKAFIRSNIGPMNYVKIAIQLGRSVGAIRMWCFRNGLTDSRKWQPNEIDALRKLGVRKAAAETGRGQFECKRKMRELRAAAQTRRRA